MTCYRTIGCTLSTLLVLLFSCCQINTVDAQKVVQIETRGKIKTKKFYEGDELSVRLVGEKFWHHTFVYAIYPEDNIIEFDFGTASLDEIDAIKTPKQRGMGKQVRNVLLIAGASFLIYAPLDIIYQSSPNWPLIAGGLALAPLGLVLKPIIDGLAKHKLGGRKRLRLLDLSLPEPDNQL